MSNIEEVLIIKEHDCYYGINTESVKQILRVQMITPIAMTPKAIRGLCSIEGTIMSTLDFSVLLDGRKKVVDRDAFKSRQVSINTDEHSFSLLVSEVINSIEIDQECIEYVEDKDDIIVALLKYEDEIVQIISIDKLIEDISLPTYVAKEVYDLSKDKTTDTSSKSYVQRYLFFMMGGEQYALEVDYVREIISIPSSFTAIAESNKEITGMMSLREDLLVVADLREYYDFNVKMSDKNRIIVSQYKGRYMGLIVDEIIDIQDVDTSKIEGMPENFKDKKINGVLHFNEKLISVVNTEVIRDLIKEQSHLIGEQAEVINETQEEDELNLEVVIFKMADEEYAFDIDDVSEIIDMTEITPMADTIDNIKGVINIRGQVISIASLYSILELKEKGCETEQQIVITMVDDTRVGFIVDKVNDVRNINSTEINEDGEKDRIFSKILQLDEGERLVMMFNTHNLLSTLNVDEKGVA